MISRKMLITMYEYSFFLVGQSIKEINHQDSLITTPGSPNPANWILGHIMVSRCNVLAMLKIEPPWDFDRQAKDNPFFAQVWYADHDPGEDNFYSEESIHDILDADREWAKRS